MRRRLHIATATTPALTPLTACRGADGGSGEETTTSLDDGSTRTLRTPQAATEPGSKAYAEAYHASRKNKVRVTAYPNEEYPAKLASAAGARALPGLFAADVVFFAPQYAPRGLWRDATDRFGALAVKEKAAPVRRRQG